MMKNTKLKIKKKKNSRENNMLKNMKNQISILSMVLCSIILIIIPSNVYAEEIEVKSFSLDETAILQITNYSNENLDMFRIWLGDDNSFKSFKTEKGWRGEKTPQGVIKFTSTKSLEPQETVKFGIKTNEKNSGINWKALNQKNEQIDIGKVLSKEIPQVQINSKINQNSKEGIKDESTFNVIPKKPNPGSFIRVIGEGFGENEEFEFSIDTKIIGSFVTNEKGNFITTMKIPEEQESDRVNFKIKDKSGNEKKLSIRLGELENRIEKLPNNKLTIQNIPNIVHRGDILEFSGTATPNKSITLKIIGTDGKMLNNKIIKVGNDGKWKTDPFLIKSDADFGKYSITVSEGREKMLKNWKVESDKIIKINSSHLKYEQGDIMKFNGTALPNKSIEVIIENPLGKELFSKKFQTDESGNVKFEFQTEKTSIKGTYTIIINQEKFKELLFTGLGELPTIPTKIEFDKLNYKSNDVANILVTGEASKSINLLIIDPSDKQIGETISLTLQSDGKKTHQLDLANYSSGVYTAVITKGSSQNNKIFTVGLQTGSGEINFSTTKTEYKPGESILVLGNTGENSILIISLVDNKGNTIKEKEMFSDKNGKISYNGLRIPSDIKSGEWTINVKSGSNFNTMFFREYFEILTARHRTIFIHNFNDRSRR